MINEERWTRIQGAFSDWSLEDVYTLRKAIELKQVDTYWELGIIHVARVKLLALEFRYDDLLQTIAKCLCERVEDYKGIRMMQDRDLTIDDIEMLFRHQPLTDSANGKGDIIIYDVMKCKYKARLIKKYPESKDIIEDLVNL